MISERWHRAQPSRKLINTGCCHCLPPPPHPAPAFLPGFPPSLPLRFLLCCGCFSLSAAVGFQPLGHRDVQDTGLLGSHPWGSSIPTSPVPSCIGIPHPRNKSRFKCHQLRLSPSPLFPRQQSCPSLPFLSFPVTFPGNKLQGAIMPCAKENIKAGTISVEDVARRAATQKRAGKFIKLPVGWSTHLQCTRSPSELSEISLLFLLLFIFPSLQGTK